MKFTIFVVVLIFGLVFAAPYHSTGQFRHETFNTPAFSTVVNATRGAGGCQTPCTGALPALTVTSGDTIIVTAASNPATGTTSPTFTIADTQSNTYTQQVQQTWQAHTFDKALVIFTATASAGGSDTITLTGSDGAGNFMQWFSTGEDYSGVVAELNTATVYNVVNPANSGNNQVTITSSATFSTIIELAASLSLGGSGTNVCGSGANLLVMNPSNGQTVRNGNCQATLGSIELSDVTGLSGASTIGFAWTNNIANCDGTNGCAIEQVALELTGTAPVTTGGGTTTSTGASPYGSNPVTFPCCSPVTANALQGSYLRAPDIDPTPFEYLFLLIFAVTLGSYLVIRSVSKPKTNTRQYEIALKR